MQKRIALILAVTASVLTYTITVPEKLFYWGTYPFIADGSWRSLVGHTYNFLFNMLHPRSLTSVLSLDFQVPNSVLPPQIYFSYPQGFLFFPYLYFKISGGNPSYESFYVFSLLNQAVVSFLLSAAVFLAIKDSFKNFRLPLILALATQAAFVLSPPSFTWYGNTWWPDTAALTSVSLLLFWAMRGRKGKAEYAILFLCACTDWYSLLVACTYIALHFEPKKIEETIKRAASVGLGIGLFFVPIFANSGWLSLVKVFLKRAHVSTTVGEGRLTSWGHLWRLLSWQLTPWPVLFYAVFLFFAVWSSYYLWRKKNREKPVLLAFLLTIPIIAHLVILSQHYVHHPFEILKYALPGAVFLPALVPVLLYRKFPNWLVLIIPAGAIYLLALQIPMLRSRLHDFTINTPQKYLELCQAMERLPGKPIFLLPPNRTEHRELEYSIQFVCGENIFEMKDEFTPRTIFRIFRERKVAVITPREHPPAANWRPYLSTKAVVADWEIHPITWPLNWLDQINQ